MLVYHYNHQTGEYAGRSQAKVDPAELALGRARYLIPAYATDVPPPPLTDHESAVWTGSAWNIVADYRFVEHYDPNTGSPKTITVLGETPAVTTPPPEDFRAPRWTGKDWEDTNPLTVAEKRQREYDVAGLTAQSLVVALWEKMIEGRSEAADAIQTKRLEIKAKHPKG